jgi:hypothetical protein
MATMLPIGLFGASPKSEKPSRDFRPTSAAKLFASPQQNPRGRKISKNKAARESQATASRALVLSPNRWVLTPRRLSSDT